MSTFQIKSQSPAARCELCHQTDCFDPVANQCSRCSAVLSHLAHSGRLQASQVDVPFLRLAPRGTPLGRALGLPVLAVFGLVAAEVIPVPGWTALLLQWSILATAVLGLAVNLAKSSFDGSADPVDAPLRIFRGQRLARFCYVSCLSIIAFHIGVNVLPARRLFASVESGDRTTLSLLFGVGMDIEKRNERGLTPLMTAAERGDRRMVEFLLEHRADPRNRDFDDRTALFHASATGDRKTLELLLRHSASTVDRPDFLGRTPLMEALLNDQPDAAEDLLEAAVNVRGTTSSGLSPLMIAAFRGHVGIVTELLRREVDVNAVDESGNTALHYAVGDTQLQPYWDNRSKTENLDREVPLRDRFEIVRRLIEAGAAVPTPFHFQTRQRADAVVLKGLLAGAQNPMDGFDFEGTPALVLAVQDESHDRIAFLLSHGADPDRSTFNGVTALMEAAANGDAHAVKLLLDKGANPALRDRSGRTADDRADRAGNPDAAASIRQLLRNARPTSR